MKLIAKITHEQLDSLPKSSLIGIIKGMENYLVSMSNTNDEMSGHRDASRAMGQAYKSAAGMLQIFVEEEPKR